MVNGNSGRNVTAVVVIFNEAGIIYYEMKNQCVTKEIFEDFMSSVSAILGEEGAVFLMDNGQNVAINSGFQDIKYLSPNTTCLNLI